jgi:hypothetical protein
VSPEDKARLAAQLDEAKHAVAPALNAAAQGLMTVSLALASTAAAWRRPKGKP